MSTEIQLKLAAVSVQSFKNSTTAIQENLKQIRLWIAAAQKAGKATLVSDLQKMASALEITKNKTADLTKEIGGLGKATVEINKTEHLLQEALGKTKSEYAAVNEKAAIFYGQLKKGTIDQETAKKAVSQFQTAMQNLNADIIAATKGGSALNKNIKYETILELQRAGALKVTNSAITNMNEMAQKRMGLSKKQIEAVRQQRSEYSLYEKALNTATIKTEAFGQGVIALGKKFGTTDKAFLTADKSIRQVEASLEGLRAKQLASGKNVGWIQNLDRYKLTLAALNGTIKITKNGIEALTDKGLRALGQKSVGAARENGVLVASFDKLSTRTAALKQKYPELINAQNKFGRNSEKIIDLFSRTKISYEQAGNALKKQKQGFAEYNKKSESLKTAENAAFKLQQQFQALRNGEHAYTTSTRWLIKEVANQNASFTDAQAVLRTHLVLLREEQKAQRQSAKEKENTRKGVLQLRTAYQELLKDKGSLRDAVNEEIRKFALEGKSIDKVKRKLTLLQNVQKQERVELEAQKASIQAQIDSIYKLKNKYTILINTENKYKSTAEALILLLEKEAGAQKAVEISLARLDARRKSSDTEEKKSAEKKKNISAAILRLNNDYALLLKTENKYTQKTKALINAVKEQGASIQRVEPILRRWKNEVKNSNREVTGFRGALNALTRSFKTYSRYMLASGLLRKTVDTFRQAKEGVIAYDQVLHDLTAILNATTTEVSLMGKALISTTMRTKFSIEETGTAMRLMGQSGFTAMEAVQGIDDVANLATGTLEGLDSTVKLITATIRVFQLDMDETSKVVDIFANAVNNSRLTIDRINTSMNYIGPIAKAAKLSLKDTSAALMLLANAGVRASTSATGLRRMIGMLVNPTKAFKAAIIGAGYTLDEFNPELVSFTSIIEKLPHVVDGAGDAIEMFGLRGSAVVSAIAEMGSDEFTRLYSTLDETGTASRMAAEQMKGMGIIIKNIADRFQVLAKVVGEGSGITALMRGVLQVFKQFLGVLVYLAGTPMGKFVLMMSAVSAGITAITVGLMAWKALGMGSVIAKITAALTFQNVTMISTVSIMAALETTMLGLTTAAAATAGAFMNLSLALIGLLSNPIILGLAAVAAGVWYIHRAATSTKKEMNELAENTKIFVTEISNASDKINSHNKTVKEYGKYSDNAKKSALGLREAILKLRDEEVLSEKEAQSYITMIDKKTGAFINQEETLDRLSKKLDEVYNKRVRKVVNEIQKISWVNSIRGMQSYSNAAQILIAQIQNWQESDLATEKRLVFWSEKGVEKYNKRKHAVQKYHEQMRNLPPILQESAAAYLELELAANSSSDTQGLYSKKFEILKDLTKRQTQSILSTVKVYKLTGEQIHKLVEERYGTENELAKAAITIQVARAAESAKKQRTIYSDLMESFSEDQRKFAKGESSFDVLLSQYNEVVKKIEEKHKDLIDTLLSIKPSKIKGYKKQIDTIAGFSDGLWFQDAGIGEVLQKEENDTLLAPISEAVKSQSAKLEDALETASSRAKEAWIHGWANGADGKPSMSEQLKAELVDIDTGAAKAVRDLTKKFDTGKGNSVVQGYKISSIFDIEKIEIEIAAAEQKVAAFSKIIKEAGSPGIDITSENNKEIRKLVKQKVEQEQKILDNRVSLIKLGLAKVEELYVADADKHQRMVEKQIRTQGGTQKQRILLQIQAEEENRKILQNSINTANKLEADHTKFIRSQNDKIQESNKKTQNLKITLVEKALAKEEAALKTTKSLVDAINKELDYENRYSEGASAAMQRRFDAEESSRTAHIKALNDANTEWRKLIAEENKKGADRDVSYIGELTKKIKLSQKEINTLIILLREFKAEEAEKIKNQGIIDGSDDIKQVVLGIDTAIHSFKSMGEIITEGWKRTINTMSSATSQFFQDIVLKTKHTEDAFKSLAKSVGQSMLQMGTDMAAQQAMNWLWGADSGNTGDNTGAIKGAWGFVKDLFVNKQHTGGLVGASGGMQTPVSPFAFVNAPRLHNGLRADEFPAILQKGEEVISKRDVQNRKDKGVSDIHISLINESGEKLVATKKEPVFDKDKMILNVVLSAVGNNKSGFGKNMSNALSRY